MKMAPGNNGVGASSYTRYKQQHLNQILRTHLLICSKVIPKNHWAHEEYHYFDLNAGPGTYSYDDEIIKGSPLVFLEEQKSINIKCHAVFFEIDDGHRTKLVRNVANYADKPGLTLAFHGNHEKFLPCYFPTLLQKRVKKVFGLVYSDPTGSSPPFDLVQTMLARKCFSTLDILFYFSATNYKRQLMAPACPLSNRLDEILRSINKKHWIVREPYGNHQWTFLIGTNWTDFPKFERIGFHRIDSPKGKGIFAKLNYTNLEMKSNGDFGHYHASPL
jgi:three-Cys-motif partner protein